MDPVRNPFAPGAGSAPPELSGREAILADAMTALRRTLIGNHSKSLILLGLRGTGKTVLLNKIEEMAEGESHVTAYIEAPENRPLAEMLYPKIHQALRKFSMVEAAKHKAFQALRALKSFAGVNKIEVGGVSISVEPEAGSADSGDLETDLAELFLRLGEAARSAGRAWALLIDEVQYLNERDFSALIVAIHRATQKRLPIIFFGAGLPQVAALSGDAKSYAERLFDYPPIGALPRDAAIAAIRQPIESAGESISDDALRAIIEETRGYPYFLQEWGYQVWDLAEASPITPNVVTLASRAAIRRLDEGFFRVRMDRLTPRERDYVFAMACLGPGPYRSGDVAAKLDMPIESLGPRRAAIIRKGMIYSPAHGDIAFTVPLFDHYLRRIGAAGKDP
jgi:AAA+ ATPase superfamily predicted ATPase